MNDTLLKSYFQARRVGRRYWVQVSTTLLMAGVGVLGTPGGLYGQERPGGAFGGDENYWTDSTGEGLFAPETAADSVGGSGSIMGELCWLMTIFQKLVIAASVIAMFYWSFQAARGGQTNKWKLAALALFVAAFVNDPAAWLGLFGIDVWTTSSEGLFGLYTISSDPWACLSGGPGWDFAF